MTAHVAGRDTALLAPTDLAEKLSIRPVLSSPSDGWQDLVLQRFRDLPSTIDVPGMRDDVLVCHLAGPFLAEVGTGTGRFERRWIGPGHLGVDPTGLPVHRVLTGKPDVVLVHLVPEAVRATAEEMFGVDPARVTLVPRLAEPDETAVQFIRVLLSEAESPMAGTSLMTETLSRALMVHTLRHHSNLTLRRSDSPASLSAGRVRRVIDYMRTHMDQPLSLAKLARLSGQSPSRFARAFRDATGQPPHRFLIGLRIEQARDLLERTDLPVIDIGLRCGFEQPGHFATMFRQVTGMTPRTWRRERRA